MKMDQEAAVMVGKGITALISAIQGAMGEAAAMEFVDGLRQTMVDEGRPPNDQEIDTMMDRVRARSDAIQNA